MNQNLPPDSQMLTNNSRCINSFMSFKYLKYVEFETWLATLIIKENLVSSSTSSNVNVNSSTMPGTRIKIGHALGSSRVSCCIHVIIGYTPAVYDVHHNVYML